MQKTITIIAESLDQLISDIKIMGALGFRQEQGQFYHHGCDDGQPTFSIALIIPTHFYPPHTHPAA